MAQRGCDLHSSSARSVAVHQGPLTAAVQGPGGYSSMCLKSMGAHHACLAVMHSKLLACSFQTKQSTTSKSLSACARLALVHGHRASTSALRSVAMLSHVCTDSGRSCTRS